jgi:hypothetical protein
MTMLLELYACAYWFAIYSDMPLLQFRLPLNLVRRAASISTNWHTVLLYC